LSAFLLIHGAWHGGWCWHKVVARLRAAGHGALAPDLPSLGRDRTPPAGITLESWTESVVAHLDAHAEPVILVGHSRAGVLISGAAEARPERIRLLVYLAAYLLGEGESVSQRALQDRDSLVVPNMVPSADRKTAKLRAQSVREALYGQCTEEDVILAQSLLAPEAITPLTTPLHITPENFGRVPRVYIECRRDRAVSLAEQRRMYAAVPCREIRSMDTDHAPFFSAPDELAQHLLSLAS
jgi:pimeloyl-ACP methyl ester carboxylesterase